MILGGGQCQKCKCIPCDPCGQECTNPHTGDPFEVVYTKYTLGAESGNLTDGYLTASGDNDTSDPVDGMDGTGPWSQTITGTITLGDGRFPCTTHMSFWRQSGVLGPQTPGTTPSAALTVNRITVVATSGTAQVLGPGVGVVIKAGTDSDTASLEDKIPVAAGDATDPITSGYAVRIQAVCGITVTVQITAEIEWNVSQRQHTLYGIVRECYEEGTPCAEFCDGDPPPDEIYLTISNLSVTAQSGPFAYPSYTQLDSMSAFLEGTFVLSRVPGYCGLWSGSASGGECEGVGGLPGVAILAWNGGISIGVGIGRGNSCLWLVSFKAEIPELSLPICGASYSETGTGTDISFRGPYVNTYTGSFDWEITT